MTLAAVELNDPTTSPTIAPPAPAKRRLDPGLRALAALVRQLELMPQAERRAAIVWLADRFRIEE